MTYADAIKELTVEPGKSVMINMNETGDTKIIWDRSKTVEIDMARDAFNKAKKAGYMAYKVKGEKGEKGEIMHGFDENAERIILAPPLAGG